MTDVDITREVVTPARAKELLESNYCNRPINPKAVRQYAMAMSRGDWVFVGDPIRISDTGQLLDGQHRLHAVIQSGKAVELLIITGIPADQQDRMDTGRKRTAGDWLSMRGIKSGNVVASVASAAMSWLVDDYPSRQLAWSIHDIAEFVETNPDTIRDATTWGMSVGNRLRGSAAQAGAAYFIAQGIAPHSAVEFYTALTKGTNLDEDNPILVLRNTLLRHKTGDRRKLMKPGVEAFWIARAWNAWRDGDTLAKIQLPKGGELSAADYRMR